MLIGVSHDQSDVEVQNREQLIQTKEHRIALDCILTGIEAAQPENVINSQVEVNNAVLSINETEYDLDQFSRVLVIGGGNAAGRVAKSLEELIQRHITDGIIVTDNPVELSAISCVQGSHPVPNQSAVEGTKQVLDLARAADKDDLIITIITGGGSALLPAPVNNISLSELQEVTSNLLTSGATIGEINTVRKHLSAIKGGQLARAAAPARAVGLVFSDVVGNDLSTIASGPLASDETTFNDALTVLDWYEITPPESVYMHLDQGRQGKCEETPTSDMQCFDRVDTHILADNRTAIQAAENYATDKGYETLILSSSIRGEAREVAKVHVGVAEEIISSGHPVEPPAVLLSGGETTVTVQGSGDGGPSQEFAVSAALEIDDPRIIVSSVDTDGIDGSVNVAGGIVDKSVKEKLSHRKLRSALNCNDAYKVLESVNATIKTGQTGTNVNDLRAIVVAE